MSGEGNTSEAAAPQCQFFVQRKKRLCRMTVKPGRRYCGEHEPQPITDAGQADKRIPCPNDPKHTCYASKLLKHLAICNARRTDQPPYIVHNINCPEEVEPCPRRPLSSIPKDELNNVIDKINRLYAKHVEDQIIDEPTPPIHHTVLGEFNSPDRTESSRRHLRQVSALLALAERAGLVRDHTCYVELGAGKGQLSYYACHAWCGGGGSRVLAVDRAPLRHKRDNKLRSAPPAPRTHGDPATHSDTTQPVSTDAQANSTNDNGLTDSDIDRNPKETEQNSKSSITMNSSIESDKPTDQHGSETSTVDPVSRLQGGHAGVGEPDQNTCNTSTDSSTESDKPLNKHGSETSAVDPAFRLQGGRALGDEQNQNTNMNIDSDRPTDERGSSPLRGWEGSEVAVRLRADLAHVALQAVPAVAAAQSLVGLAKHLCGVATDLALRCVAAEGLGHKTRGVVLATCCHHRVLPAPYVGTQHLQELGISVEDLNTMLGIVSWATCGDGRSRERRAQQGTAAPAAQHGLSQPEREEVGRKAKALVDWGRVLWLRARTLDARLVRFVPRHVSPENLAIVATRR